MIQSTINNTNPTFERHEHDLGLNFLACPTTPPLRVVEKTQPRPQAL